MILVIGATGNVGRHVLSQLHAIDAADVRALVRPGKAAHLPNGVDVATGSLDDPDGMTAALTGVKTVFLVWPFLTTEGAPAALEAIGQHAQRLVYLSSIGVGGRPEEQADPIFKLHADMERLIEARGLPRTVLRSDTIASNPWAGPSSSAPPGWCVALLPHRRRSSTRATSQPSLPARSPTTPTWVRPTG